MNTRTLITAVMALFIAPIAFGQMYGGGYSQPQPAPQRSASGSTQTKGATKTTMPVGVKGYLDAQVASSSDKKFHVSLNGKDVALTPVKFNQEQKLSGGKGATAVDMKSADGKIYEIDFVTSNGQVTGAKVGKIDGKAP